MKKTLVVAALVLVSIMPTMPANASAMKAAVVKAASTPVYCFFLPLLPKCIDAWKSEMGSMKMGMKTAMKK
jgi:hypothetical protein